MAFQLEPLAVAVPGLRAVRSRGDELFVGLKESLTITRVEEGRARFWTRGREWEASRGAIVIQQAGDVHRELSRDGFVTYQVIRVSPHHVGELPSDVRLRSYLGDGDARATALHRLHDAVAAGSDRFALECALAEAIGAMAALGEDRFLHTRPVRRALAMIREQLADALTLDELARHAGLDKFHLCRAFRAQIGMPPHAYLTQLRIMRAKELLAAGAKPHDVATQVGLYDQSQLNRHFRRIVGMTPGQFARSS